MIPQVVRPAVLMLLTMTVLTGVIYPLAVTGVAQLLFADQANGSLIHDGQRVVGSALVGQPIDEPRDFWCRPSATGPYPYNAANSSGSNQGVNEPNLIQAVKDRIAALKQADPDNEQPIPVDLITASASGLDPHISPAAANYQVTRVAKARGVDVKQVRDLVARHTEKRTFGLLGEDRVNVMALNRDLDSAK